jgi:hypothetical protein
MPGMEKVNDLRVPPFTEQKSSWMSWLVSRRFNKEKVLSWERWYPFGSSS